jgi:hypothetical protein
MRMHRLRWSVFPRQHDGQDAPAQHNVCRDLRMGAVVRAPIVDFPEQLSAEQVESAEVMLPIWYLRLTD